MGCELYEQLVDVNKASVSVTVNQAYRLAMASALRHAALLVKSRASLSLASMPYFLKQEVDGRLATLVMG